MLSHSHIFKRCFLDWIGNSCSFQYTGVVLWIVRYNGVMNANTDTLVFVILVVIFAISIHWSKHGRDSMVPGECRDICNIGICVGFRFDLET